MSENDIDNSLPYGFKSISEMIKYYSPLAGNADEDCSNDPEVIELIAREITEFRKARDEAEKIALELVAEEENEKIKGEQQKSKKDRKTERKKKQRQKKKSRKHELSDDCNKNEECDKRDKDVVEEEESFDVNSAFVANVAAKISNTKQVTKDVSSRIDPNVECLDNSFPSSEEHPVTILALEGFNFAKDGCLYDAIEKFSEAIFLTPEDYRLYANRCLCYLKISEFNKALSDAESCIKCAPDYAMGYFRMGEAYLGLNEIQLAERAFEKVLKIDPNCEEALNDLVFLRMRKLTDMGFSRKIATEALLKMKTLHAAIDYLLYSSNNFGEEEINDTSQLEDIRGLEIYQSDDEIEENENGGDQDKSAVKNTERLHNKIYKDSDTISVVSSALISDEVAVENGRREIKDPYTDYKNPYRCPRLYIGNVSTKISRKLLQSTFSRYGNIISYKIIQSSKCAFVTYEDWKSAGEAMEKLQNWSLMQGTPPLVIKYPYTDLQKLIGNLGTIIPEKPTFQTDNLSCGSAERDNWCSQTMPPPSPAPSLSSVGSSYSQAVLHSSQRKMKIDSRYVSGNKSASLYIGNLTHKVKESDLLSLFSKYGQVVSVRVLPEKKCAFVNFTNNNSAALAMSNLQGRSLFAGLPPLVIKYPTKAVKTVDPRSSSSTGDGQRIGDECYNWRTLGCTLGKGCPNKHIPEHRGIALRHKAVSSYNF